MADRRKGVAGSQHGTETAQNWEALFERSRQLTTKYQGQLKKSDDFEVVDPAAISSLFVDVARSLFAKPDKLRAAQANLSENYAKLWEATQAATKGEKRAPLAEPDKLDRRFKDDEWSENPLFDAIKQYYLLTTRWLEAMVREAEGLDPKTRQKAEFYTRQFISAMAPTNFVATNPVVLRAAQKTEGESLRKGFSNMLDDMERGKGKLKISLTDPEGFTPGENIAATPGKVVYRNDLMELLQYDPATETVHRRPLLIVPPWINKYYVLDLQPRNSFLKWAVDQGHTVFVISWINPDERLSHKRFDDYLLEGPLAALDAIREATGEAEVNAIGYCIGGTLLACTLAHMAAKGDNRVKSATFFTTMVEFSEPGELGVFIDEEQIGLLEKHMDKTGYMDGAQMAQVFNLLRENDLMWSSFVSNYLLGKDPPPFDILYWNSDSTRMPAMMHKFYLRNMYLENRLIEPGSITLCDTPIDLTRIKVPAYILSTREDHIAPWRSTFSATRHYSGPVRFVLAASGHIAGVINPPAANKYCYWTRPRKVKSPEAWLKGATQHDGSWWPDWDAWVSRHGGGKVAARVPGSGGLEPIEDAPGSYVRMRTD